jgi:hypothetical protein
VDAVTEVAGSQGSIIVRAIVVVWPEMAMLYGDRAVTVRLKTPASAGVVLETVNVRVPAA